MNLVPTFKLDLATDQTFHIGMFAQKMDNVAFNGLPTDYFLYAPAPRDLKIFT